MADASEFIRSFMLPEFPKCSHKPDCFNEGNPDLFGKCVECYEAEFSTPLKVELYQLEARQRELNKELLKHQTVVANRRSRLRHRCTVCEAFGQDRAFLNDIDAREHVLLNHVEGGAKEVKKTKGPTGPKKPKVEVEEESI